MEVKQTIQREIERAQRILILGHRDPDGDSAGSILALAGVLNDRDVYCYSEGPLPKRYRFLDPEGVLYGQIDPRFAPDLAIALEAPSRERLGAGQAMLGAGTRLINVDHHPDNHRYGDIDWVDPSAAAVAEMVFDLVRAWERPISPHVATCLYTAILTDTGRFQYRSTSAGTLAICSELVRLGADPTQITRQVYYGLPLSYLLLMQQALMGMEQAADGRVLAFTLLPEHFEAAGAAPQDAEGIIDLTLVSDDIRIGILFRQPAPGEVKVSFRSQDSVDVGQLASEWGGGGHMNASGCVVHGDLAQVKSEVMRRAVRMVEVSS